MKLLRFLPLLLLLCGCAREVSPVSALALDCKNGMYCLTAEVVRQDSPDDTAAPAYLSATGTDVTDALRNWRTIFAVKTMCGSACGQPSCGTALPPSC